MSTPTTINDATPLGSDLVSVVEDRWIGRSVPSDRTFRVALICATLMHGSLLIGVGTSAQRQIGDESGSDEAIAVSLISEAEFLSETSVVVPPSPPPGQALPPSEPAPQVQPTPPPPPVANEQPSPQTQPAEPPTDATPTETPAEPAPPEPPDQLSQSKADAPKVIEPPVTTAAAPEIAKDIPDLFSLDAPARSAQKKESVEPPTQRKADASDAPPQKAASKPKPKSVPQKTAKLDLSPPPPSFNAPVGGGGQASFSRPPGITKSGLNDAFARAVVRALQQTMPQLRETRGRVTVRILLNENGNVREVQLVTPSPLGNLNQSVVFAARQTSYPIPPGGSNEADRTFLITYVYN